MMLGVSPSPAMPTAADFWVACGLDPEREKKQGGLLPRLPRLPLLLLLLLPPLPDASTRWAWQA